MAKKKKKKEGKSSNIILFLIVTIVGSGVFYNYYKKSGGNTDFSFIKETLSLPSSESSEQKEVTSSEKTETKNVESDYINSQDGEVEQETTNNDLPSYENENPYYFSSSFDFAWPAYTQKNAIVEHTYFTLRYNEKAEQADWVAYKLTAKNLANAQYKRKDNFKADPMVQTKSASKDDYKGSGYDRGHLAPAADFTWTKSGLDETFYMSNMSPQQPGFNRGIWKKLEEKVRKWARSNNEIYVVTGPILSGNTKKIGKNKVAVPNKYYKVILELNGDDVKGIAFVLNNEKSSADLGSFSMSIDKAEKITNLDFFPNLPDDLEQSIECCSKYSDW